MVILYLILLEKMFIHERKGIQMFTVAFLILFLASVGSLLVSARQFSQKESKETPRSPSFAFLGILVVLTSVLVSSSDFKYKTAAFVFMIVSLLADWLYADWRSSSKSKEPKSSRRLWWQVADNTAWVVLTLLLFVG